MPQRRNKNVVKKMAHSTRSGLDNPNFRCCQSSEGARSFLEFGMKEGFWLGLDQAPFVPTATIRLITERVNNGESLMPVWYDPYWDQVGWTWMEDGAKGVGDGVGAGALNTIYDVADISNDVVGIANNYVDEFGYPGSSSVPSSGPPSAPSSGKSIESMPTNKLSVTQPVDPQPTATDALSVGTPQSNARWLETSPADALQSNAQTTSRSTKIPKFSIGAKVKVTDNLNVRDDPGLYSSTVISTKTTGSTATVLSDSYYVDGFTWWELLYDDGTTGWSQEKRLELVSPNQQSVAQSTESGLGKNQISVTKQVDSQPDLAFGDNQPPFALPKETDFEDNELTITQPVDQPVASIYTSQIPVGDTQTKYFSSGDLPPGKVPLSLDIRDGNGNIVPAGTTVTVKDGSGEYVQVDWDSTGHTLAYGAPGTWTITADAPGYETNTQYTTVLGSSSTSFRMNLLKDGINNQPVPIISPPINQPTNQPVIQQPTLSVSNVPLELDLRNENGNTVPVGTIVTVKDGNGNIVPVNWDSYGHALAYGAPGNWIIAVDAPGYSRNTQYVAVSSSSSSTSFRMNLLKGGINLLPLESLPPVDLQPVTQPIGSSFGDNQQQVLTSAENQPVPQTQNERLSQEQKDDILINYLESKTQGKDLSEQEVNDLMNQLDEMNNQLEQQSATPPEEPAFGD